MGPALAGVQLPLTHLTSETIRPESDQTWSLKLPDRSAGSQETLHHMLDGAAVVGALVGVASFVPVAVQSAVIHPLFCKGKDLQ